MSEPQPARRRLAGLATVGGFRAGSVLAKTMPFIVSNRIASALGFTSSFANQERREMIARHLRRVNPRLTGSALRVAVQGAFDSYARYYLDTLRLPGLSARAVDRVFSIEGFEHVEASVRAGSGTILALPHLGGWEWAGRWITDRGYRLTVVVEELQPPELFEWFKDLRAELGMTVVATGPEAGVAVLRALRDNEVVCLLCDRDLERNGVEVEFFGERTTLPAGPATLALRTGAPILPVGVYFDDGRLNGHHAVVRPPLATQRRGRLRDDVARVTQSLAYELELLIRRAPDQWHMFQPNWPSDPGYYD